MSVSRTAAFSLAALALTVSACKDSAPEQTSPDAPAGTATGTATASAAGTIEAREDNFEAISKANKAIREELDGDAPDLAAVAANAADIAERGTRIPGFFPAGTGPESGEKTEALAAIWEKPAEFSAAADRLVTSARALENAAKGGDIAATNAAAATLGGSCKGCHDSFRQKKS